MREFIWGFSYIICAFIPVLTITFLSNRFSMRLFWTSWLLSLTGAFAGGVFGNIVMHRLGFDFGLLVGIIPAVLGAWLLTSIFLRLRAVPGNW